MVEAIGLPSQHGDGNNVFEIEKIAQKAVQEIRQGKGPYFLEFSTYRWREHCGPNYDNDLGYRTEEEFQTWKKHDPVCLLQSKMIEDNSITLQGLEEMKKSINEEIDLAFQFATESPFPKQEEAYNSVYK